MKRTLVTIALAGLFPTLGVAVPAAAAEGQADGTQAIAKNVNEASVVNGGSFVQVQQYGNRGGPRGGRPEAVLFSNPDFNGDRWIIRGDYMADFANTGFNDRAQSLRVFSGYWIFCSDAQFRGRCRTFGPGDYPRLGWALDNKVSSGRRISERYPYGGRPNWGDR
jgi:beta/gamma crystallin